MQIGYIQISNELVLAIALVAGFLVYFMIKKLSPVQKVEVLLHNPAYPEGRRFPGEESYVENRVSYFKKNGFRKTEKVDLKREYGPMVEYRGASRVLVYRAFQDEGATATWGKSDSESNASTEYTYSDIAKFNVLNDGLGRAALNSAKQQLFNILIGIPIGALIMLILTRFIPAL